MPDIGGRLPTLGRALPGLSRMPFAPRRRGVSASAAAGLGLLGAGLGAALMYLFDPELGPQRRAAARDRVQGWLQQSGAAMDGASRDVASRARGLVIEMRSRWRRGEHDEPTSAQPPTNG
jgi:hypothetical protein